MNTNKPLNEIPLECLEAEIKRRQGKKNFKSLYPKNLKGAKALLSAILDSYDQSDQYERSIDYDLIEYANEYLAEKVK
jgi:hypothetical protein